MQRVYDPMDWWRRIWLAVIRKRWTDNVYFICTWNINVFYGRVNYHSYWRSMIILCCNGKFFSHTSLWKIQKKRNERKKIPSLMTGGHDNKSKKIFFFEWKKQWNFFFVLFCLKIKIFIRWQWWWSSSFIIDWTAIVKRKKFFFFLILGLSFLFHIWKVFDHIQCSGPAIMDFVTPVYTKHNDWSWS